MAQAGDAAAPCEGGAVDSRQHRTTRRREESRRRLIEAARDTFAERGIRETPVELICERAGFTRGAFYSNFSSKEDLFLAVYQQETAIRQRLFAEAVASAVELPAPGDLPALRAAVADMARWYVTAHTGDETWFLLLSEFKLQGMRRPELRARVEAALQEGVDELSRVIEGFVTRAGLTLAVEIRYAAQAVLALYEDALAQNLLAGRPMTADNELLTRVLPRLLSGLLD
jgi:AcrR family transcriptional regulator